MDRNERILSRILQEHSGRRGALGNRAERRLVGAVVVVFAAAVGLQLASSSIAVTKPSTASSPDLEPLATTAPEPNPQSVSLASAPHASTEMDNRRRYVVQPGDSLESIAARNGLRPDTLASVNELENPDLLQPGRELVVPLTDGIVHIVEAGETLRLIADRYHVDVASLIAANDLPVPDHIPAGLRLFVPGARPPAVSQRPNP
jgi:LysM repeat protein